MTGPEAPDLGSRRPLAGPRLLGCLAALALAATVGWWCWGRVAATLRWGCAESVLWMATKTCLQCGLEGESQEAILARVRPFAAAVEAGRASMGQGLALMRRFERGPLRAALFLAGVAGRLAVDGEPGAAPPASEAALMANFFDLYKSGRLASGSLEDLWQRLTGERELTFRRPSGLVIRERMAVLKPGFTAEEREDALGFMALAIASAAGTAASDPPPGSASGTPPPAFDPVAEAEAAIAAIAPKTR